MTQESKSTNKLAPTLTPERVLGASLEEKLASLPTDPGCYLMRDASGEVFYVGKARNLRARVRNYFNGSDTRQFVAWLDQLLADIDVVIVRNEKEALLLERSLVQEHKPAFNVLLQDDKNFIHLRLDDKSAKRASATANKRVRYPRIEVVRGPRNDGARYFGPYHSASSVRAALRVVNRYFQLRTCRDHVLENRVRPCLQYQIGRCPAPCVQEVEDYPSHIDDAGLFLAGQIGELREKLDKRMWAAADDERFETAARLRDQLQAVESSSLSQVVTDVKNRRDQDVIGVARQGSFLEVARLVIRDGHMRRSDVFAFQQQEFPTSELVASFLGQLYTTLSPTELPDEVLLSAPVEEAESLSALLTERRQRSTAVFCPQRGQKRRLVEIAERNALNAIETRMASARTRRGTLEDLAKRLHLDEVPSVIECFDISLFQGSEPVASKVCFVDGEPDKKRYRRFNIKTVDGTDDFAMLYEAITRRLSGKEPPPDLLFVDGGKGQLNVAVAACQDLGIEVPLASIAKARAKTPGGGGPVDERVFLPGQKNPIPLKKHTQVRYLIERLRDEAHRFAITGHRRRRAKRTLTSDLDAISGVGPARKKALFARFGSVKKMRAATVDEIAGVPGISAALARRITEALG